MSAVKVDFSRHNEEVRRVWSAFNAGVPIRVPVVFNFSRRDFLLEPGLNCWGYSFRDYFDNPEVMFRVQLEHQKWIRLNVLQDAEMGLPEVEWGGIGVDFQNLYEAAWLGCEIAYPENQVPYALPILNENKSKLYDMEIPDPLHANLMGKAYEYYEYFEAHREDWDFEGKPVGKTVIAGCGTDGIFTVGSQLRGLTELCLDLYEDPKYVHDLMGFITEATIKRIKATWELMGWEYPVQEWGFADDAIENLSPEMYKEFVLPYHHRLVNAFSKGGPNSIHLCGRVGHLLKILQQELNIQSFDLGFPVDLGKMREELGQQALLRGNVHPALLRAGPEVEIVEAVKGILGSGVMVGGRFILCDGSDVAIGTPLRHLEVMYEAGKKYGRYERD